MTERIVTVTPAGRRRYLRVLHRHLLRHRDVIDKHIWWVNTVDPEDVAYLESLAAAYPGFYELWRHDPALRLTEVSAWDIHRFYPRACDPDTTYIRMDDDIVWLDGDAIARLAACRRAHPEPFLVYGNIVNNARCNYLHQQNGAVAGEVGELTWRCNCPLGWKDPVNAGRFHANFFRHLGAGTTGRYRFDDRVLDGYERFSINVISWLGRDFAEFAGEVGHDEERWLSVIKPHGSGRPAMICGDALFVHFAYFTQRDYLEAETNFLDAYTAVAEGEPIPALKRGEGGGSPPPPVMAVPTKTDPTPA
jgi:hypothetical protein